MSLGRKPGLPLGGGAGAGGGGIAVTVAAADATDEVKERADYVCDGSDDGPTIQLAINTAGSGGLVQLSGGSFFTETMVDMGANQVTLQGIGTNWGSGPGTSIERMGAMSGNPMFDIGGSRLYIRDLSILDYANAVNTGPLVEYYGGALYLDRVWMENDQGQAVRLTGSNSLLVANECDLEANTEVVMATSNGRVVASNSYLYGYTSGYVIDLIGGYVTLTNCVVDGAGGVRQAAGANTPYMTISDCEVNGWDTGNAIEVSSTVGAFAKIYIADNVIDGGGGGHSGISIDLGTYSGSSSPTKVRIADNMIFSMGRHGIVLTDVVDGHITGNHVHGCSQTTDDTYSGIILLANCDRNFITGNLVRRNDSVVPKMKYGIRIDNSNCDHNTIMNNDLYNAAKSGGTGGNYSDAGTSTSASGNRV
jgi:hypothetical protein